VLASDGHWNELGHALIAERVANHMQRPMHVVARQAP